MSSLHDSRLGDFTRGGQVTLHFLRMTAQVFKKFAGALLILYFVLTAGLWYSQTEPYERYIGWRYVASNVGVWYGNGTTIVPFKQYDGSYVRTSVNSLARSQSMKDVTWGLGTTWFISMGYSMATTSVLLIVIFAWLLRFGKAQRDEQLLRGGSIIEAAELDRVFRKKKVASALKIAGMPMLKGSETSHILVTGSPGTGKSVTLHELLRVIRARGDRVITYSPSGDFIEKFFRPGDHIMNPFDVRCPSWNIWDECTAPYHYDMIAEAIVPEPTKGDPFWNNSARSLISCLLSTMKERGNTDIADFYKLLTRTSLEGLHKYLKGTEAAALIDPESEKTAVSIRATAAVYARSMKYIPLEGDTFHIRQWVHEEGSEWVHLNAKPDQISSVRPLISAWLEVFSNSLMSLPASRTRRVWLVLDELPSLNKIPSLKGFLAQGRKYGGCGVIAFQQLSQLRGTYGRDDAESLTGLCATWVTMRQNDPETAKWVANSFGESEISEMQQGVSYGAHEIRDGVSLTANRKKREILLPSEISTLDDLEGYVRFPGDVPVGHFKLDYKPLPQAATDFEPRPLAEFPKHADDDAPDPIEPLPQESEDAPVERERAQVFTLPGHEKASDSEDDDMPGFTPGKFT